MVISFFKLAFVFSLYLVSSFRINFSLESGLALVVFPRSRPCLLYENDNILLIEMATTVPNGNDRSKWQRPFTNGKIASATLMKVVALNEPHTNKISATALTIATKPSHDYIHPDDQPTTNTHSL